jgi:pyrroloquinoline quinone (PQQ) biosynthesis protein C
VSDFERNQRLLAQFNRDRLTPGVGVHPFTPHAQSMFALEESFVAESRDRIQDLLHDVPVEPKPFVSWFEALQDHGPGQGDPLFPWLEARANLSQLRWFLAQEVAGEAGFEDLLSVTQVKMPVRAKLEMARNFWDEMGRGQEAGMHGLMLGRLSRALGLEPAIETTVPESLALGNMMVALAFNRRYAFQSIGAMGAIELTAPTRAVHVVAALRRLGVSRRDSHYFALHAAIDLRHSAAWNAEVISSLVSEERARIRPIAEGALLRLWCGLGCFKRYRAEFGLST